MKLSAFRGKRILVTGASGYLASRLMETLSTVPCHLIGVTRKVHTVLPRPIQATLTVVEADVRKAKDWDRLLRSPVDYIFHFAAQTSVPEAEAHPEADAEINVIPMVLLLEACRKKKIKPVIVYAATATQVGLVRRSRVKEIIPDQPVTVYDFHKLIAESFLKSYIHQGLVRGCSLRLFNVYGPGPKSSSGTRGILNQMVRRALSGEPLTIYGQGQFRRDYVYVEDVVRAFWMAALRIRKTNGHHFYIGSGKGMMLAEAFRRVATFSKRIAGRQVRVRHVPAPRDLSPIEARSYVADFTRFRKATGWTPEVSFNDGIRRTVRYFQGLES